MQLSQLGPNTLMSSMTASFQATMLIVGSTIICDLTELATRLCFCADCKAQRVRFSTTDCSSAPAAILICGQKRKCVKISVRFNSISCVPSDWRAWRGVTLDRFDRGDLIANGQCASNWLGLRESHVATALLQEVR